MRQEMIAQYLVRSKERMEKQMGVAKRPNLADMLEKIQGVDEEEDDVRFFFGSDSPISAYGIILTNVVCSIPLRLFPWHSAPRAV